MSDELSIASGGSTLATEAAAPGQPVAANQSQHGDSRLEAILAKKARGEKLTRSEAGCLGGKRKQAKPSVAAKTNQNILFDLPENPENPLFDAPASNGASPQAPVAPAVNSALLRGAANSVLSSLDLVTQIYVGHEAKQAGSDKATIKSYQTAVALQPEHRQLIVENSEPLVLSLCSLLKCRPDQLENTLKHSGVLGGFAVWGLTIFNTVKSLRESKAENEARKKSESAKT